MRIAFLSVDEALVIHERLIEVFGGSGELRDGGALESALYRPQTGYYPDLAAMAAALFESLLMNHPFVDGNKRMAFFSTDVFLRLNGWRLDVESDVAFSFIRERLEAGTLDFEHLEPWIRKSIRESPSE